MASERGLVLQPATQAELSRWITQACGVILGPDKAYLLEHRLTGLLTELKIDTFETLRDRLLDGRIAGLHERVVESIVTHETSFFRDRHPFEAYRQNLLPACRSRWLADRSSSMMPARPIRIWSAACSTGQEPVSLAIGALEWLRTGGAADLRPSDIRIVATDISNRIIQQARTGRYSDGDLSRGMSPELRTRYFRPENGSWVLENEPAGMIEYRRFNFVEAGFGLGIFDLVFCRNVLIYFDDALKKRVIEELQRSLAPGGYLMLGSAESLYGISDKFQSLVMQGSQVYLRT